MLADFENVLGRLNIVSHNGEKAMSFCPAHDDGNNPSLSLKAENGRLLLHCFAGCQPEDIISKIGLEMKNLFSEGGGGSSIPPCTPAPLHAECEKVHEQAENGRAGVKERAVPNARPDEAQDPHGNTQYSSDAYKACSRARVQEGIKDPPPLSGSEPQEADNPQYDTLEEEVRNLFAQDTVEER